LEGVTCARNFHPLRGPVWAADSPDGVHVTVAADSSIAAATTPLIGVVMGSASDFDTLAPACEILAELGIPYEARVVSAHRTPDWLFEYAETAFPRGLRVIIAGAGGAAHLPGMLAAKTLVPVLGVPVVATPLNGMDALLSIVQMPAGVPVATFAIGKPGAANAALFAAQLLAATDAPLREKLAARRSSKAIDALARPLAAPNAILASDFIPSAT
jgi:5-(carboxyamino)imidazole ribonucleotide mutase